MKYKYGDDKGESPIYLVIIVSFDRINTLTLRFTSFLPGDTVAVCSNGLEAIIMVGRAN